MARLDTPAVKKPRLTAAQKRAQAALASVGTDTSPARRGEDDDELTEAAAAAASAPAEAEPETQVPHQVDKKVHEPSLDAVELSTEATAEFFTFDKPSPDLDPLEQMGAARRGIVRANRGLDNGLGALQKGYVSSAGEYLWWATQFTRLKDAGFSSIERFAGQLGMTKQDVYRLRRAVPVYRIIGHLVDEALNERTIRELFTTIVDEKGEIPVTPDGEPNVSPERQKNLLEQFAEMKKMGRVNSGGAIAARRLLMLGEQTGAIEIEPGTEPGPGVVDQLAKARRTNRIVSLEVLREAKEKDPEAAKRYVDELRRAADAAAEILK
ncbi:hypothetical protein [Streptomyces mirabilis]|uniref:hypothetical protein n=1 Tax=Streptomyces mirabilis TaxID=68239 RepID=UPI0036C6953D